MPEQIRVCPKCAEPVIFTFEFPGAEYHCVACGWLGGIFQDAQLNATPDLLARSGELHARYELERAARTGRPAPKPKPEAPRPACVGCGKPAEGPMDGDKPRHWYSRTKDGVKQFACSRDCIPTSQPILPW